VRCSCSRPFSATLSHTPTPRSDKEKKKKKEKEKEEKERLKSAKEGGQRVAAIKQGEKEYPKAQTASSNAALNVKKAQDALKRRTAQYEKNVERIALEKYPIEDTALEEAGQSKDLVARPKARSFRVDQGVLHKDALQVWDFTRSFASDLEITPFSLEMFLDALARTSTLPVLLAETCMGLMKLLLDDDVVNGASEPLPKKEDADESAQSVEVPVLEATAATAPPGELELVYEANGLGLTPKYPSPITAGSVSPLSWQLLLRVLLPRLAVFQADAANPVTRSVMAALESGQFVGLKAGSKLLCFKWLVGAAMSSVKCKQIVDDNWRRRQEVTSELAAIYKERKKQETAVTAERRVKAVSRVRAANIAAARKNGALIDDMGEPLQAAAADDAADVQAPPKKKAKAAAAASAAAAAADGDKEQAAKPKAKPKKPATEPKAAQVTAMMKLLEQEEVSNGAAIAELPTIPDVSDDEGDSDGEESSADAAAAEQSCLTGMTRTQRAEYTKVHGERAGMTKRQRRVDREKRRSEKADSERWQNEVTDSLQDAVADECNKSKCAAELKAAKDCGLIWTVDDDDGVEKKFCTAEVMNMYEYKHALLERQGAGDGSADLEHTLATTFVRTLPIGIDRQYRRYWVFDPDEAKVFVQEFDPPHESLASTGQAGAKDLERFRGLDLDKRSASWRYFEGEKSLLALGKSLDNRGVRESALKKALQKHNDVWFDGGAQQEGGAGASAASAAAESPSVLVDEYINNQKATPKELAKQELEKHVPLTLAGLGRWVLREEDELKTQLKLLHAEWVSRGGEERGSWRATLEDPPSLRTVCDALAGLEEVLRKAHPHSVEEPEHSERKAKIADGYQFGAGNGNHEFVGKRMRSFQTTEHPSIVNCHDGTVLAHWLHQPKPAGDQAAAAADAAAEVKPELYFHVVRDRDDPSSKDDQPPEGWWDVSYDEVRKGIQAYEQNLERDPDAGSNGNGNGESPMETDEGGDNGDAAASDAPDEAMGEVENWKEQTRSDGKTASLWQHTAQREGWLRAVKHAKSIGHATVAAEMLFARCRLHGLGTPPAEPLAARKRKVTGYGE
jgi:hypothetical protein